MTDLPPPKDLSGITKMIILVSALALCAIIGYGSSLYFGKDNPIEQTVEQLLDAEVENILNLPNDSVNIDLSPEK